MNPLHRFAYATGRAVGAGLREFLDTMYPATDPQAAEAMRSDIWGSPSTTMHEVGTPGIADISVPTERVVWRPEVNDGTRPIDPRWSCSDPGKFTINAQPTSMDDALAGVDDETDWFDWARPAIAEVLESGQWLAPEWIDTVSGIVTERIAADPAKAIAALWNYQLSRNEAT
jgi:hypothetical protein